MLSVIQNDPVLCPLELHCDGERSSGDEKYRCAAYLKWMATGSLNVHSVCLRHLLNFGAFCIGLLTQPEAEQHMREKIVPHSLPVRNYCTSKLQDTWRHMQSNLCMAEEEVLFLVLKCLYCFLQVFSDFSHLRPQPMLLSMNIQYECSAHLSILLYICYNYFVLSILEIFGTAF